MAVDTRDRRMSMIGLASPVPRVLPDPDGTIGEEDRIMLLFGYWSTSVEIADLDRTTEIAGRWAPDVALEGRWAQSIELEGRA